MSINFNFTWEILFCFVLLIETGSYYVAIAGLKHVMKISLASCS